MAKVQWGEKRNCGSCDATFYDMQQNPIICPKCSHEHKTDKPRKLRSTATRVKKTSARKKAGEIQLNNDFESQLFHELAPGDDAAFVNDADEFFTDNRGWEDNLRF